MSAERPILILQMQRMGDLILSYPLILWLSRNHPGRPIWVMAEELFYGQLVQVSPQGVVYFPWTGKSLQHLRSHAFHLVLNLSHDPRAALLAGEVESEEVYGPVQQEGGPRYVRGDWQLYRASLTGSNRHNRFHWADLNALDAVPLADIAATRWGAPRIITPEASRKVGLFLGASQRAKRPSAGFWSALARELIRRDMRPMLLGGPAEKELAAKVARDVPARIVNLAGRQTLAEFAFLGQTMGMMITPDTGPMHLAAWSGLLTLNLSMGNVNCWETGPYQGGHAVLRPHMSCTGCWECARDPLRCGRSFLPRQVAHVADRLNRRDLDGFRKRPIAGMDLMLTARTREGLYALNPLAPPAAPSARTLLDDCWQRFWGARFGLWNRDMAAASFARLGQDHPKLRQAMRKGLVRLSRDLKKGLLPGGCGLPDGDFWRAAPALQPVRSYCQMYLENADASTRAWGECLGLVEDLLALIEG
ncbi:glycosyltransferase family 9 protein [Desulfocurvus sp. DL9XJH121]